MVVVVSHDGDDYGEGGDYYGLGVLRMVTATTVVVVVS